MSADFHALARDVRHRFRAYLTDVAPKAGQWKMARMISDDCRILTNKFSAIFIGRICGNDPRVMCNYTSYTIHDLIALGHADWLHMITPCNSRLYTRDDIVALHKNPAAAPEIVHIQNMTRDAYEYCVDNSIAVSGIASCTYGRDKNDNRISPMNINCHLDNIVLPTIEDDEEYYCYETDIFLFAEFSLTSIPKLLQMMSRNPPDVDDAKRTVIALRTLYNRHRSSREKIADYTNIRHPTSYFGRPHVDGDTYDLMVPSGGSLVNVCYATPEWWAKHNNYSHPMKLVQVGGDLILVSLWGNMEQIFKNFGIYYKALIIRMADDIAQSMYEIRALPGGVDYHFGMHDC